MVGPARDFGSLKAITARLQVSVTKDPRFQITTLAPGIFL